ncbi:hypothetical protein BUALT_Bualt07G0012600 [Buddleja alternifolia]|uniref:Uncharacterized protein n=1 Tax=Buddleja alternifolia TaxID=168488 RepID=A0AAV6X6E8_9LAMI|nr:hypothetical protein BUALT_Bualt07G0012600 [Buddleja alternifolia]
MADAAVEFLLQNLQQLLIYHAKLIIGAEKEVEQLEKNLRLFKAFLKDSTKKRRKDDTLKELVRQIRDVVYEAEDIIDAFVTQAAEIKTKSYFARAFKTTAKLHAIARQVEVVAKEVNVIYGGKGRLDFANFIAAAADGGPEEQEVPLLRQDNVVGFEDEAEKIFGYLNEKAEHLDVISVIGMPGLGKTTLAGKIFHDPAIQYQFPTRIWVYVSQEFTKRGIFLAILRELITNLPEDTYHKTDQELARMVATQLEKGKFLIVMDDVWTTTDWDKLQTALPNKNNSGKVLITSRHEEVARHANRSRSPHKLRLLTLAESWLLLQYEVFGKAECPSELEILGKLIAEQCNGLPLALVVIGGILVKKFPATEDLGARKRAWAKVSNSVNAYLQEDPERRMEKIIALSYDKLPYHLRACFLYLGMFPEDFEIPVWKLIRMWIAEGFIQQKESISLEETAENHLEDLINRNLVRIDKVRRDGRVKTCRIHDMLRDFCKNEAGNEKENFLQEIKKSNEGKFEPSVEKSRRLCIHSNVLSFVSLRPFVFGHHVRSFVCFSKEEIALPPENSSAIPAAFKLLRVLDVKPINFPRIPSDMYQLVHVRYIHLSFDLKILPQAFSKLWNIQTLIVDTTSRTLEIKAEIWKMMHLRHLKTNASATLPKPGKSSKEGGKFRTLGTISPESCTEEVFDRARNLKKLGIRGKLATLLDGKTGGSFDSLGRLGNLEKLKLLNDVFPHPPSESQLASLPPAYKFPPKLKSLTISDTHLDWGQMSILGLLENLEVLKLENNAFMGRAWETADGGFRNLEVLHIGRTNLVIWTCSAHHFPKLRRLELSNCEELQEIPIELADIPSLQLLNLFRAISAAASAKKIEVAKQNMQEGTSKGSGFKLSIYPPKE